MQLSKSVIHAEQSDFIRMIEQGEQVSPRDFEFRLQIFKLKLKICYFFDIWVTALIILTGLSISSYLKGTHFLLSVLILFSCIASGAWQLWVWQCEIEKIRNSDPLFELKSNKQDTVEYSDDDDV